MGWYGITVIMDILCICEGNCLAWRHQEVDNQTTDCHVFDPATVKAVPKRSVIKMSPCHLFLSLLNA